MSNQKEFLLFLTAIATLTTLWLADINVKSDRPSDQESAIAHPSKPKGVN
jgi:hypothetical protein